MSYDRLEYPAWESLAQSVLRCSHSVSARNAPRGVRNGSFEVAEGAAGPRRSSLVSLPDGSGCDRIERPGRQPIAVHEPGGGGFRKLDELLRCNLKCCSAAAVKLNACLLLPRHLE